MPVLDHVRARAHAAIARAPGRLGSVLRSTNEAFGRPLADAEELADRRAFARRGDPSTSTTPSTTAHAKVQAPVIVYFMDKQRRDVRKLTDVLDAAGITYTVTNLQDDPAAQSAVRRDSKGAGLPVAFIAGACVGGRSELANLAASGQLARLAFGG
jgi:glutaredoxin-related protein